MKNQFDFPAKTPTTNLNDLSNLDYLSTNNVIDMLQETPGGDVGAF